MRAPTEQTQTERAAAARAGALARAAKIAAGRATLRQDYLDMQEWERLAAKAGLQLPLSWQPVTPNGMRRWLSRLGIPVGAYLDWSGEESLADFAHNNPDWSLRAWAGLVLEHRDAILCGVDEGGEDDAAER